MSDAAHRRTTRKGDLPKPRVVTYVLTYELAPCITEGDGFPYKIGRAAETSLQDRIRNIQVGHPTAVILVATFFDLREEDLHNEFQGARWRGEWFALAEREVDALSARMTSEDRELLLRTQRRHLEQVDRSSFVPKWAREADEDDEDDEFDERELALLAVRTKLEKVRVASVGKGAHAAIRVIDSMLDDIDALFERGWGPERLGDVRARRAGTPLLDLELPAVGAPPDHP